MRRGVVVRTGRGLYRIPNAPITENHDLAQVANGGQARTASRVCLISALAFHEITTQVPHEIWIGLARGSRTPSLDLLRFTGRCLTESREEHNIEGVSVSIYTAAKQCRLFEVSKPGWSRRCTRRVCSPGEGDNCSDPALCRDLSRGTSHAALSGVAGMKSPAAFRERARLTPA